MNQHQIQATLQPMERDALNAMRAGQHESLKIDSLEDAQYNLCVVTCDTAAVALISECAGNQGRSVSNAIEKLATYIHAKRFPRWTAGRVTWLEHHPESEGMGGESLDRVTMLFDGKTRVYYAPRRHHIDLNE